MDKTDSLISTLKTWKLATWNEKELQSCIEIVFKDAGIEHQREVPVGEGIIDFLVGDIGLECKIGAKKAAVLEQLSRYAIDERISNLLLVTTIAAHRSIDGITLRGKQVRVYWINPIVGCANIVQARRKPVAYQG